MSSQLITPDGLTTIWSSLASHQLVQILPLCPALITTALTSTTVRTVTMAKASRVFAETEMIAAQLRHQNRQRQHQSRQQRHHQRQRQTERHPTGRRQPNGRQQLAPHLLAPVSQNVLMATSASKELASTSTSAPMEVTTATASKTAATWMEEDSCANPMKLSWKNVKLWAILHNGRGDQQRNTS